MPFPLRVRLDALIACQRYCCLCHLRKHTRIQCHHIVPEADGGLDTSENCIPLCPDCHSEVRAFDLRHPVGSTPYSRKELIQRRDDWYSVISRRSHELVTCLHRRAEQYPNTDALSGTASFDYSNHDGFYRFGRGNYEFLTHWSKGSDSAIHCYSDGTNIALAVAPIGTEISTVADASVASAKFVHKVFLTRSRIKAAEAVQMKGLGF